MSMFPDSAVCVIGYAKPPSLNPINHVHQLMVASFVADRNTGIIYEVEFNMICSITSRFLSELLVGLSLFDDLDEMQNRVKTRYFGDSRKAIIVILSDAATKLRERQKPDFIENF